MRLKHPSAYSTPGLRRWAETQRALLWRKRCAERAAVEEAVLDLRRHDTQATVGGSDRPEYPAGKLDG